MIQIGPIVDTAAAGVAVRKVVAVSLGWGTVPYGMDHWMKI